MSSEKLDRSTEPVCCSHILRFITCIYKHLYIARLYYVSLNYQKLPMGYSFYYISLVFNRTYAKNLTLIAPIDTGKWFSCFNKKHPTRLNCSGWDRNVVRSPPPFQCFHSMFFRTTFKNYVPTKIKVGKNTQAYDCLSTACARELWPT